MIRTIAQSSILAASAVLLVPAASALADGTVKGSIKFDGKMAKQGRIRISTDAFCVEAHKSDPLLKEQFVFNEELGTLCNVVVYVSSPVSGSFETPGDAVVVKQVGCQYMPHVNGIMVNQPMEIHNNDATAHNLKLQAQNNPGFNVGQPIQGMVHEVKFSNPEYDGPMPLKCDVHSWMNAYIAVFPHPFFAVSDDKGQFEIKGLPAGKHTLTVWHEFDKFTPVQKTIEVEVKDGAVTEVDFTYQPPQ